MKQFGPRTNEFCLPSKHLHGVVEICRGESIRMPGSEAASNSLLSRL